MSNKYKVIAAFADYIRNQVGYATKQDVAAALDAVLGLYKDPSPDQPVAKAKSDCKTCHGRGSVTFDVGGAMWAEPCEDCDAGRALKEKQLDPPPSDTALCERIRKTFFYCEGSPDAAWEKAFSTQLLPYLADLRMQLDPKRSKPTMEQCQAAAAKIFARRNCTLRELTVIIARHVGVKV